MAKKNIKSKFFLFNIVKPDSGLEKDEISLISKIAYTVAFILVIIDIIAILFYIKTNKRLESLSNHEYTLDINKSLNEAKAQHNEYATRSKESIEEKQTYLRSLVKRLEFDQVMAKKLNPGKVELASLEKLSTLINKFHNNKYKNSDLLHEAILDYDDTENELIRLNNYLMPLTEINKYNKQLGEYLETMLNEIQDTQSTFLNQMHHLSKMQITMQNDLKDNISETTKYFDEYYQSMVQMNRFKKINNFYEAKFLEYDNQYIPYSVEFERNVFGAILTESVEFHLRISRVYICNIQAVIKSEYAFEINFEYVDRKNNGEEILLQQSEYVRGLFKEPAVYNNFFAFDLKKGFHNLYLRTTSKGLASNIQISRLRFDCLSYRNFGIKNSDYDIYY